MINPPQTISELIVSLTDGASIQADYQHDLITSPGALSLMQKFSRQVSQDAMEQATRRGEDVGTALMVGAESSIVAMMLLGVEYGRMVERDQARSLEAMLTDFPEGRE